MSNTAALWKGDFGRDYTARNRVDWRARIPFWRNVLDMTGARSVYEVGCNAGWNLSALKHADPLVQVYGHDLNERAVVQARAAGHQDVVLRSFGPEAGGNYDLVFTAGVLIHISPVELRRAMFDILDASADYVLAVEYHAEQEEEVLYRGHTGALWRRPYGKLYQDMGLQLVKEWDAGAGFDKCLASLLRKQATP